MMMRKTEALRILALLAVFNLSGLLLAQDNAVRGLTFAVGLNISPVLFYHFEQSDARSIRNNYNFQTGISLYHYKKINSHRFGISSGFLFGTKKFEVTYHDDWTLGKATHNYSLLKIPALLNYSYQFKNTIIGGGFGLYFNFFQNSSWEMEYKSGTYDNDFSGDLQFDPFTEFVVIINIEQVIPRHKLSFGLQPFLLYNLSDPIFFSHSFYNIGKTAFGLNIVMKRFFNYKTRK